MILMKLYCSPAFEGGKHDRIVAAAQERLGVPIRSMQTEACFYVQVREQLSDEEYARLCSLLQNDTEPDGLREHSFLDANQTVIEIGPRLSCETAFSSNAVAICQACGLHKVEWLECSRRFALPVELTPEQRQQFIEPLYDRMTEEEYEAPLQSFEAKTKVDPVRIIPVVEKGLPVLEEINSQLGLSMDKQDLAAYYNLFTVELQRNPTDVAMGQLGQANSEHSRHPFFKGKQVIDGVEMPETLMEIVQKPWRVHPGNSKVAYDDDSSAIAGKEITVLVPEKPGQPSPIVRIRRTLNPTLSVESHNWPTGIEPYEGAATGIGGLFRDLMAVRLGGLVTILFAGYCTGNLYIPGYELPWEQDEWLHPDNLASPLDIMIRASDGASDYANCVGKPVTMGFTRTCGQVVSGEYRSWYKPLMYAGGMGQFDDQHNVKYQPQKGMLVCQIGGPAYDIGVGGGSASSVISGAIKDVELAFKSVQRGDPKMEQCIYRVGVTCVQLGEKNPIRGKVDLGAGGDCNAIPELVNPAGALINIRAIPLGDTTLSDYVIWCNESQEREAFLVYPADLPTIQAICQRERAPLAVLGEVTGDGQFVLHGERDGLELVNFPMDKILGQLPQKVFYSERIEPELVSPRLPRDLTVEKALERVLRLPSVGSKRFLTTKADRSVGGLVVQQQCVGPNQITLCDYTVAAQGFEDVGGAASSIGEQPMIGLVSPAAMGRMAVAEAILNLAGAKITSLVDVKFSVNWMWPAKQPGEGPKLYDTARSESQAMIDLGNAGDGGKDSLSMAAIAMAPDGTACTVKAPGNLVITAYAPMDDITKKVTPDLKQPGAHLLFIDLSGGKARLGGSALLQVFQQIGDEAPDMEDAYLLSRAFRTVQQLVEQGLVSAVHDRSDGGLLVTVLEMAFAGNVGLNLRIDSDQGLLATLFNQELGLVIECNDLETVGSLLRSNHIPYQYLGTVGDYGGQVSLMYRDSMGNKWPVLNKPMIDLRFVWEATSAVLDQRQANPDCVAEESINNRRLVTPLPYRLSFTPRASSPRYNVGKQPKVAVIREQGTNGDEEMRAVLLKVGFEVWDVTMSDLLKQLITLEPFQGVVFPGGFSFKDVLGAAKGWAGVICYNDVVKKQFEDFYQRTDTFSFGVCNGCQLLARLGWVPWPGIASQLQPCFVRNTSERFESRWSAVRIESSPAIMLKGMEGSVLGVWVAHGEGRLYTKDKSLLQDIIAKQLAPLRFVDPDGQVTEVYPFNPNGSPSGITALCSEDGRHLAMMPHPERVFLKWQWPWMPPEWQDTLEASPWLRLFQNAYEWCLEHMEG